MRSSVVLIVVIASRLLGEHFGSGDGERKTLLARHIALEPLPASVLLGLLLGAVSLEFLLEIRVTTGGLKLVG